MKFAFIEEYRGRFKINFMCSRLGLARSGYYDWRNRQPSSRDIQDERLKVEIKIAFEDSDQTYGSARIHRELVEGRGIAVSKKRVARLMKELGLVADVPKAWKKTTISDGTKAAPNLVKQNFSATEPNKLWVTDITYIKTWAGWLYLAVVLDVFSRRVVGYALENTLHTELPLRALRMAIRNRSPKPDLVHHSDRGSQYGAAEYVRELNSIGAKRSMSAAGNCFDNAMAESFFATIKKELIHRYIWKTRTATRTAVDHYIQNFYNPRRRHSSIDFASPIEFELNFKKKRKAA